MIDKPPYISFDQSGNVDGRQVVGIVQLPGAGASDLNVLTPIEPPEGAPGKWFIAWHRDPQSPMADADGNVTEALIVEDGNGFHQVIDAPTEGSQTSQAWLAGLAAVPPGKGRPGGGAKPSPKGTQYQPNGELVGTNAAEFTSWTLTQPPKNGAYYRIDIENPAPGKRAGQMHLQDGTGNNANKYYYNFNTREFEGLPASDLKKFQKDPQFDRAIKKGTEYLGVE
ncbi:hypothetical protein ACWIGW_01195 [Nocardia brasiliensis]